MKIRMLDKFLFGKESLFGISDHPNLEVVEGDVRHIEDLARATKNIEEYLPQAEEKKIMLSIENIICNGFLMGPLEMKQFIDQFKSKYVGVHFDTANVGHFQFPEDWIKYLGKRISNVHIKEFNRAEASYPVLEAARQLGEGSVNWPAVIEALDSIGYRGYLNFEYYHPYKYYSEALIFHTSDYINRMLGKKPLYE